MIKIQFGLSAVSLLLILAARTPATDVSVGLSADDDGIKSFYLSVGEHYRVPEKEVIVVREKKIRDDELPVVFFIARQARVEPSLVVGLRSEGKSWIDITAHFGLSPAIYYVAFEKDPGPPYGKAWGHYKKHKKSEWKTIRLDDDDIVNCVNIKFMSERYGYSPDEVIRMRHKGQGFVVLNSKIKKAKAEKHEHSQKHADADKHGKDKHSKNNGKEKKDH